MSEQFNMEKQYNPQAIEASTYQHWEESGAFKAHRVCKNCGYYNGVQVIAHDEEK